ncbi:MAG: HDIG domain-containing protein, partial [Chloroflexota bacterium]|nr:HDIG domain-containing protein [Chloroflexota bacterium]
LLIALSTQAALVIENADLMERMRLLARDLQAAWRGTLDALASALATRDYETEAHCQRTVEMTILLARRMGVPERDLPSMVRGALLHDIGKTGIPNSILFKTGPLTFDEREIIKQHVVLGYNMLHHIPFFLLRCHASGSAPPRVI